MGVALTSAVTRMTRARARDARDTHDVRMTVRLRLRAREQASKRANETAPPPLPRVRMGDIGEGGR